MLRCIVPRLVSRYENRISSNRQERCSLLRGDVREDDIDMFIKYIQNISEYKLIKL
jgi:hypothetical protein